MRVSLKQIVFILFVMGVPQAGAESHRTDPRPSSRTAHSSSDSSVHSRRWTTTNEKGQREIWKQNLVEGKLSKVKVATETPFGWRYEGAAGDDRFRVLQKIQGTQYLIEYRYEEDRPVARILKKWVEGRWEELTSPPSFSKVPQRMQDGRVFAFQFKSGVGSAYALKFLDRNKKTGWMDIPDRDSAVARSPHVSMPHRQMVTSGDSSYVVHTNWDEDGRARYRLTHRKKGGIYQSVDPHTSEKIRMVLTDDAGSKIAVQFKEGEGTRYARKERNGEGRQVWVHDRKSPLDRFAKWVRTPPIQISFRTIAGKRYRIEYRKEKDGALIASLTHVRTSNGYVPFRGSLEKTERVRETIDGEEFAFFFKGRVGQAYAQRFEEEGVPGYWVRLPKANVKSIQQVRVAFRPLTPLEKAAQLSKEKTKALEKELSQVSQNPRVRAMMRNPTPAFHRLKSEFQSSLPNKFPSRREVVANLGARHTDLIGKDSQILVAPKNLDRPTLRLRMDPKDPLPAGLFLGSVAGANFLNLSVPVLDDLNYLNEMGSTIAKIPSRYQKGNLGSLGARDLWKMTKFFAGPRFQALSSLAEGPVRYYMGDEHNSSNTLLEVRSTELYDKGIEDKKLKERIKEMPDIIAAAAVLEAERRTGPGLLASARTRLNRAATGGLGRRLFDAEMPKARQRARAEGKKATDQLSQAIREGIWAQTYGSAARLANLFHTVGRDPKTIAVALDFSDKGMPLSNDFLIPTREGKLYVLKNIGGTESPQSPAPIPSMAFSKFNNRLMAIYKKEGGIKESDILDNALKSRLLPLKPDEFVYLAPADFPTETYPELMAQLKQAYGEEQSLDIESVAALQHSLSAQATTATKMKFPNPFGNLFKGMGFNPATDEKEGD